MDSSPSFGYLCSVNMIGCDMEAITEIKIFASQIQGFGGTLH